MALVEFRNISKEYTGRWVLQQVGFQINAQQKIGLIGPNGSGKTTILRILCGLEKPDEGAVQINSDVRVGYVPQHVDFQGDETVHDYLLREHRARHDDLRAKEHAVAAAGQDEMARAMEAYQKARDTYDYYGGDHFESRAEAMLDALGLVGRREQAVGLLSGGEKNVLALTQALLVEPNLLVLDEPGNHLDYQGLAWLDEFLTQFRGAVLIVSHNRYLLDRAVNGIMELEHGQVEYYPGNYTAYKEQKAEKLRAQQAEYENYQKRLAHLTALVQKFADIAQGHASDQTWGKRLRARRSQLEREKARAVEKPQAQLQKVSVRFEAEATKADIAMQLHNYCKAYDEKVLLDGVDWDIAGGQRWALVGPNGCGKTSLLRDVVEHGHWEHQVIRIGPSLTVGYGAQEQEVLDGNSTVFDELMAVPDTTREQVLGILARFLFKDEEVHKRIENLSGGERNRLQLARLMLYKPNFLILDEPTNHLDIPTREAVEEALREFPGTILVVSHDRYFLDRVVDHVAEIRERRLRLYEGNFTSFWQSHGKDEADIAAGGRVTQRGRARETEEKVKSKAGGQAWRQRKADAAAERKVRKQVETLEARIAELEDEKDSLTEEIAAAFTQGDNDRGHELSERLEHVSRDLEDVYEQWMAANEELAQLVDEA